VGAPYLFGSAPLVTTTTAQAITFQSIAPGNVPGQGTPIPNAADTASGGSVTPAGHASVTIANPTGSGQTITAGALSFSDVLGAITASVSYSLSAPSVVPGASQTFYFALSSGILATPKLSVTFGANPGSGTLNAVLALLPF
jgi:hypothetical protein